MSTELSHYQQPDTYPQPMQSNIPTAARGLVEWAESAGAAYDLARRLVTTSFAPAQYKNKPEEAAAAMLAGAEVGLSPMASLRAFDVIQGAAAPRAITYRAILQSMGHKIRYPEMSPTRVVARGLRQGDTEWQTVEWTIKRAQELGLTNKEQWRKQPQTMLVARATAELARLIASDAILGIPYSAEEMQDEVPEPTTTITRSQPLRTVRRTPRLEPAEPSLDEEPAAHAPEQPTTEPEPPVETRLPRTDVTGAVELITPKQLTALHTLFGLKGFHDRVDCLDYVRNERHIDVQSSKDLTKKEASDIIDALTQLDDVVKP